VLLGLALGVAPALILWRMAPATGIAQFGDTTEAVLPFVGEVSEPAISLASELSVAPMELGSK